MRCNCGIKFQFLCFCVWIDLIRTSDLDSVCVHWLLNCMQFRGLFLQISTELCFKFENFQVQKLDS